MAVADKRQYIPPPGARVICHSATQSSPVTRFILLAISDSIRSREKCRKMSNRRRV